MLNFMKRWKIRSLEKKVANLAKAREHTDPSDQDRAKEIALHYELAHLHEALQYSKAFPYARFSALESYRNASALGDPKAEYILGQRFLDQGRFWAGLVAGPFACNAHKKYAQDTFSEAFVFLQAAENQGYALAKRLRGVAFINGWGVEADPDKGFQLVIDSIQQEGAWDKATQIFSELGLNKPEFFSYIMSARKEK